jgi:hypothetical protein
MGTSPPSYPFLDEIARIRNSGQSHSIALTGNILDLFHLSQENRFAPLTNLLVSKWDAPELRGKLTIITYGRNGTISFLHGEDLPLLREAWTHLVTGRSKEDRAISRLADGGKAGQGEAEGMFDEALAQAKTSSSVALEFLRSLCLASRSTASDGKHLLQKSLVIIIEGAEMLIPPGEVARLSEADRKRISICMDWFSDPGFMDGTDMVLLLTEAKGEINEKVARLPQMLEVSIESPDLEQRRHFIDWYIASPKDSRKPQLAVEPEKLAEITAALSIQAMLQMFKGCVHACRPLGTTDVVAKVREYITSQLGDMVEFERPTHTLDDVIGNRALKDWFRNVFIPRLDETEGPGAVTGCIVAGSNGAGKTFLIDGVAGAVGMASLTLKNWRDMWFGQTDIKVNRIGRVLRALCKAIVKMDEADTQLGGLGREVHETERRSTASIQTLMAELKGRVFWIQITARVNLLPPDVKRTGRGGDFIVPVLDPAGEDLKNFIRWVLKPWNAKPEDATAAKFIQATQGRCASDFSAIKGDIYVAVKNARKLGRDLSEEEVLQVVTSRVPANIGAQRRIQELHAYLNCTVTNLLPLDEYGGDIHKAWESWSDELAVLESGVR